MCWWSERCPKAHTAASVEQAQLRNELGVSRDRQKVSELYASDWAMWFPVDGDPRHGTADDPRMVLVGVTIHAAEFLEVNKSRAVVLYELAKGWLSGTEPKIGEMHSLKP